MPRTIWLMSLLAAVAAGLTAAPVRAEEGGQPAKTVVAILDFSDTAAPGEYQGKVGKICANALSEALLAQKYFDVAERARIDQVMGEIKLQASGLVSDDEAAKIGKMLAVKYLVYGDVQGIEVGKGIGSAVGGLLGVNLVKGTRVQVHVNYKVTDVETGKVFLSRTFKEKKDVTGAADGPDLRLKLVTETLQETAQKMAQAMLPKVQGIVAVINTNDGTVIATIGTQHGLAAGAMLRIFRKGEEVKNPQTGEVIDVQITEVCKARCQSARDKASTLEIGDMAKARRGKAEWKAMKEKAAEIKVGDLVETIDVEVDK